VLRALERVARRNPPSDGGGAGSMIEEAV